MIESNQKMTKPSKTCGSRETLEDLQETLRLLKIQIELQRQEFTKKIEQLEKRIPQIEIHDSFNTIQHIHLIGADVSQLTDDLKQLIVK